MSQAKSVVKVQVNQSALIRNLGAVFTDKTKVLSELLQNGRRAGATFIGITFDASHQTLVVTDNGCGISDMQDLLTVAGSGWNAETRVSESAFGMGFLATLFTAKVVKVESKGKQIAFCTTDAINMDSITVEPSDFIGGTRVTLEGFDVTEAKINVALVLGSKFTMPYSAGFPVPITFNGAKLVRPDVCDDRFIDTEIGKMRLFCPKQERYASGLVNHQAGHAFLQGLPVNAGVIPGNTVVHLSSEFTARMPDRDVLLDLDEASKRIQRVITSEYRKYFENMKSIEPMQLFDDANYNVICHFNLLDLLNDIDVLPAAFFVEYSEFPVENEYGNCVTVCTGSEITRDQLDVGDVIALVNIPSAGEWGENSMALAMLAWKLKFVMLTKSLHPNHWALQLAYPRADEIDENGNVKADVTLDFKALTVSGDITLVDSYTVSYKGKSHTFTDDAVSVGDEGFEESRLIVPDGEHGDQVLSQFNSWMCDDQYDENWRETEEAFFRDRLAILRGEDPAVTLQKSIGWNIRTNTNLAGRSFTVSFQDGQVIVCEVSTK